MRSPVPTFIYWGTAGSGKTHLLQATREGATRARRAGRLDRPT